MINFIFLISLFIHYAAAINWQTEVNLFYAEGCDWKNNNLTNVPSTGPQCGPKCATTVGCTHFTWSQFNGGTCWLKKTPITPNQAITLTGGVCGYLKDQSDPGPGPTSCSNGWKILKKFDFSSISKINQDWNVSTLPAGKYNNEKQKYTTDSRNVFSRSGHLIIKAYKDGATSFSSGRLESRQTYTPIDAPGKKLRVEYTGKVPTISGAWPGYWLLGSFANYGGYPNEGEMDVMEWVQSISGTFRSSLHWGSGPDQTTSRDFLLTADEMRKNFITYGVEWSAAPNDEYVQFYMRRPNGQVTNSQKFNRNTWSNFVPCPATGRKLGQFPCSHLAPFDNQMQIIVNLAIGGSWGGIGVSDNDYNAFLTGVEFDTSDISVCQKL